MLRVHANKFHADHCCILCNTHSHSERSIEFDRYIATTRIVRLCKAYFFHRRRNRLFYLLNTTVRTVII